MLINKNRESRLTLFDLTVIFVACLVFAEMILEGWR